MATRRLFGSSRGDISLKLIAESTMMVAICFAIGLALALCVEAEAAELFKGKIALKSDLTPATVSLCLGFILAIGIVSGILPSWQMSRFQPIDIVKGSFRFHSKMVLGRLFIMVQNVITITMLTSSFVIWLQLNHLIHAPLGFNTENLYYVYAPQENSQAVRSQLEKMPFVERIGTFQNTSFTGYSCSLRTLIRDGRYVKVFLSDLDQAAFDLYGLKIIKDYGATNGGYYLTEEAVRQLNLSEDDRELDWGNGEKIPIAGVLADIHRINVLNGVEPFAIRLQATADSSVSFLVKTNGYGQAKPAFLAMLRELEVPEMELEWAVNSLEDNIADTFADQQNTLRIVSLFALIAIVISVMGYVGMSLFFIRQRKKEIAIRKVMGATSGEVLALMLRTFSAPLLVSFVIAVPVSWHIMTDWLSNFSYRIALSPWIFAAAGATSFIVSLLTIIVQSWHAASENPINNIKTE
jgi:putative ABC transport system permease protein